MYNIKTCKHQLYLNYWRGAVVTWAFPRATRRWFEFSRARVIYFCRVWVLSANEALCVIKYKLRDFLWQNLPRQPLPETPRWLVSPPIRVYTPFSPFCSGLPPPWYRLVKIIKVDSNLHVLPQLWYFHAINSHFRHCIQPHKTLLSMMPCELRAMEMVHS